MLACLAPIDCVQIEGLLVDVEVREKRIKELEAQLALVRLPLFQSHESPLSLVRSARVPIQFPLSYASASV